MFQVFCHCLSSNYTAKTGLNIPMEIVCVCNRKAIVGIRCSCIKKPISDHYDTYPCHYVSLYGKFHVANRDDVLLFNHFRLRILTCIKR